MEEAIESLKQIGFIVEVEAFYISERRQWNAFLIKDGYRIELILPETNDKAQKANAAKIGSSLMGGVGVYHICYESTNFDEDIKLMRKNGYLPISKIEDEPSYGGRLQFFYNNKLGIAEVIEINK